MTILVTIKSTVLWISLKLILPSNTSSVIIASVLHKVHNYKYSHWEACPCIHQSERYMLEILIAIIITSMKIVLLVENIMLLSANSLQNTFVYCILENDQNQICFNNGYVYVTRNIILFYFQKFTIKSSPDQKHCHCSEHTVSTQFWLLTTLNISTITEHPFWMYPLKRNRRGFTPGHNHPKPMQWL